jgi:RNA polymerase sigma factor (TIGR02999 family)
MTSDYMTSLSGEVSQLLNELSDGDRESEVRLVHPVYGELRHSAILCLHGVATRLMRRILIDYARDIQAVKRGGEKKASLEDFLVYSEEGNGELWAINEVLSRLPDWPPAQGRVLELRFFGECSEEEIAKILGVSETTVNRDWRVARAWLFPELSNK